MRCPACGADNREGANFCHDCGSQVAAPSLREEAPNVPLAIVPLANVPLADQAQVESLRDETPTGVPVEGQEPSAEAAESAPDSFGSEPGIAPELEVAPDAGEGWVEEPIEEIPAPEDLYHPLRLEAEKGEPPITPEAEGQLAAEPEGVEESGGMEPGLPPEPSAEREAEASPRGEDVAAELREPEVLTGDEVEDDELALEAGPAKEEAGSLVPVEPGSLLAERYVVVGAEDAGDDEILYHVRDLKACWHCGFEENQPDEDFCAQCGASLDRRPDRTLLEVRDPESIPAGDRDVAAQFGHEGRTFLLLEGPEVEQATETPARHQGLRLVVGQRSDAGHVRELDEDSLLALNLSATYESETQPVLGLFAVADGMGGHEGGEIASKLALQVMAREVLQTIILPELAGESGSDARVVELLRAATVAANDAVYLARQKRENDMGTTLTTVYVRDEQLFIAHVGDCRAYRWNEEGLQQLTTDHSLVASMVATGRAEPEEIYTHPQRSVIYRCVGDQAIVEVDTGVLPLSPGDRLVVCCDGLWEMIRNEGIADVMMQESDPEVACDLLVHRANAAGGDDNISVIVVQVEALRESPS